MAFYDIIDGSYQIMQEYADEAFDAALEFLEELGKLAVNLNIPDVSYIWKPLPDIPGMKVATAPADVVIVPVFPNPPSEFIPTTITPPTVDTPPIYDVIKPVFLFPTRPAPIDIGTAPVAPETDTDVVYPTAPAYTIPGIPDLQDIVLPILDPLEYPEFTTTAPDDTFVVVPGNIFAYSEEYYQSDLLTSIQESLRERITTGGTGLNPDVEQALWDRERNREDQAALKAKDEIRSEFANRGFPLPPGVAYQKALEVSVGTQNKIISLGRDIAIKQAELEQENVKHALSETVRLEGVLVNNWNDIMQRKFEVARYTQEVAINIFNAQLGLYNAQLSAYNIEAQVYNTIIQGELAKVEAYKAQIDAQALINQINKTSVDIYSEQIRTIAILTDVYKTELEAVALVLQTEKTKIDIYLGEMQGYVAEIDAKKTEFETYKVTVDAETARIDAYSAEVQAYSERVRAYSTEVTALTDVQKLTLDTERLRLDSHTNLLDSYKTQVEAESTRVKSEADTYIALVQAYSAKTSAYSTEFEAGMKQFEGALKENTSRIDSEIKQAEINIMKVIEENKLLIETVKAGGLLSAELAAAALTAINVSAGMDASFNDSTNHNYNYEV